MQIRIKTIYFLIVAVWIKSFLCCAVAQEGDSESYASVYEVKAGDTPESVAGHFLGRAEFGEELLAFNKLNRDEFGARYGKLISLPGKSFPEAAIAMQDAHEWLDTARSKAAETYAKKTFSTAKHLYALSVKAWEKATFDKAKHLSIVALAAAKEAARLADINALIDEEVKVLKLHNFVWVNRIQNKNLVPMKETDTLQVGDQLKTDKLSRILLKFPDGSELLLHEESQIKIISLSLDRRNQCRAMAVEIIEGSVKGDMLDAQLQEAYTKIIIRNLSCNIQGSKSLISHNGKGKGSVSVHDGRITLNADKEKSVALNAGHFVEFDSKRGFGKINKHYGELEVIQPEKSPKVTGNQLYTFEWSVKNPELSKLAAVHRLDLFRDKDHVELVQSHPAKALKQAADVLPEGIYYWSLRSENKEGVALNRSVGGELRVKKDLSNTSSLSNPAFSFEGKKIISPKHVIFAKSADKESSVVSFEFSTNGGPFIPRTEGFTLNEYGENIIRYRAVSADGVKGPESIAEYLLDNIAPSVSVLLSTEPGANEEKTLIFVELMARDEYGVKAILYHLGDGNFNVFKETLVFNPAEQNRLFYKAVDMLDNESPVQEVILPNIK